MTLHSRILKAKQANAEYMTNPLLLGFSLDECKAIDNIADSDQFVRGKVKEILDLLHDYDVDYDEKLKSAFEAYSEAATYIQLREKGIPLERVRETKSKRPDFQFKHAGQTYYIEIKTLSFADGASNYRQTMEEGLEAEIHLQDQVASGKDISFSETEIQPLRKDSSIYDPISQKYRPIYDPTSPRYFIETIIKKINQNIKIEQLELGDSFLLIDMSLFPGRYEEWSLPIFQEKTYGSMVSGALWHIAFATLNEMIFRPIEFEGKSNIDGRLQCEGVLVQHTFLKGLLFRTTLLSGQRYITAFIRSNEPEQIRNIIAVMSNYWNDDLNTNGWKVLQNHFSEGTRHVKVVTKDMVESRAYSIWENEGREHGKDWAHWFKAKEELGLSHDLHI